MAHEEIPLMIEAGPVTLAGDMVYPDQTGMLVLFAHGSGSSRHSPRNRYVARVLQDAGLGTLLFDLLTTEEGREDERSRALRFDIRLLAQRLIQASEWVKNNPATSPYNLGYFGASTGSAAALIAAAQLPQYISAVVSRGGRPDMAGDALNRVQAPTLLIVGGNDTQVIMINQGALALLRTERKLEIVPGASHLFEEPGTLEQAAGLARDWFIQHQQEMMACI
jgi:dienelactone hydrolase